MKNLYKLKTKCIQKPSLQRSILPLKNKSNMLLLTHGLHHWSFLWVMEYLVLFLLLNKIYLKKKS